MRTKINPNSFTVWLSRNDTYTWAHKTGAAWPCSMLSNKRVVASFDANGLYDFAVNGKGDDIDGNELSAIVADSMRDLLPAEHPAYFVAVGQFTND
ncbi:MAG TPA: hypothetical protein VLA24_10695 [Pseudomonadales bacterium]|nr:hypothetical protein [Pseudomonadales bacterium]